MGCRSEEMALQALSIPVTQSSPTFHLDSHVKFSVNSTFLNLKNILITLG